MDIKGRRIVTGACGPYNLGGSTTEWSERSLQSLCRIGLRKLQNGLG